MESGSISAYGDFHGIDVIKKGSVTVNGGGIYAFSKAISKEDNSSTTVTVIAGTFKGELPEDSIIGDTTDPDADGVYTVTAKSVVAEEVNDPMLSEESTSDPVDTTDIVEDSSIETTDTVDEPVVESVDEPIVEQPEVVKEQPKAAKKTKTKKTKKVEVKKVEEKVEDKNVEVEEVETKKAEEKPIVEVIKSDPVKTTTSYALRSNTTVYLTPSTKKPVGSVIGAVTLVGNEVTDPSTGVSYRKIIYVLRGIGKKAVGFIPASAIKE
jgi:outer membrane biosynthesis protein TonB